MLPETTIDLERMIARDKPDKTYAILTAKEVLAGTIEQLEAVKQAVYLVLNIERYDSLIYSPNYGIELKDLFGTDIDYACPELKRRIEEALLQDDRVLSVDGFEFSSVKGVVTASFQVHTIYGDFITEQGVNL